METHDVDVAILGAGSAGLAAHAAASRHTDSLLLIEGGTYGTTCARVGCMPSKLLIAAAEAHRAASEAGRFGIDVSGIGVDGAAVMQRVRALRDDFVGSVLRGMERIPPQRLLRGRARFLDPYTLDVNGRRLRAGRVVIATGSAPTVPEVYAGLGDRLLTSDNIFELPDLPASLAVIGGGVIGLELGQALHQLGVRVRVFHSRDHLGPKGDPALETAATALFRRHLPVELSTRAEVLGSDAEGVDIGWTDGQGDRHRERFERVLVALGRRPNLDGLGLEHTGLALDARGIPLFDPATLRCGDSGIFIAGDANNDHPLLHVAAEEGRIAGENAVRFPDVRAHRRQVRLAIAFTEPQSAIVGAGPETLAPGSYAVGQVDFSDQGRSRVIGRAAGLARLYGDRATGRLLGAQMVGPAVEHLAHLLAWTVQQGLTVDEILALPFYHPVIEEGLRTALRELQQELRTLLPEAGCLDCGPGG